MDRGAMLAAQADTSLWFTGVDGARLAADSVGSGRPVLLLHGGGQTRGSWRRTARELADEGYRAITIDARGHGDSDWATAGYSLRLLADDLRCVMEQIGGAPALIGASLGGLTALVALGDDDPPPASVLVLVDIATRTKPEGRSAIHRFMKGNPDGFATVDEAADAVSRYLTHRPRPTNVEGLRRNLRERDGRFFWHWDPAFMSGEGKAWPSLDLDAAAGRITVPTLMVRGEHSELVGKESVDHMRSLIPHVDVAEVAGAGHMVAGDANSPFSTAIRIFLRRTYPAAG
jgi:pimeloyl-ACP methyl ester carboxylesterase